MAKKLLAIIFIFSSVSIAKAQMQAQPTDDKGHLSGDVEVDATWFDRDTLIGTSTTQYLHEKSSTEGWFTLNYLISGWSFTARYDMYNNSALLDPTIAYTGQGLGFYQIDKKIDKWEFTAGDFYDQFGSGILFRAWQNRYLGLDYAVQGVRVQYTPNDSFMIKGFAGQQKDRFTIWPQIMKGLNAEKIWGIGNVGMLTGVGFLNRTLDQGTMNQLANEINGLPYSQRFTPMYINQQLENLSGDVLYAGASYSFYGFGVNVQYKKIESFIMKTTPYATILDGIMNYLPPLSKQETTRLPSLYSVSAQSQGENGIQAEVTYAVDKRNNFDFNVSYIKKPDNTVLYREYYAEYNKIISKNVKMELGVQSLIYNYAVYEGHPGDVVHTVTPFFEMSIRLGNAHKIAEGTAENKMPLQKSLRFELQYLSTKQDSGSFAYALVEYNLAPKWSFAVSDMYNIIPQHTNDLKLNYYSTFISYTEKQTRFTIGYAKQVAGVICTGGVCRVEPAFSGIRASIGTNF